LHRDQPPLRPEERKLVLDVLRRTPSTDCVVRAAVVMDDHVHLLGRPARGCSAAKLAQAWKSISSHELVKLQGRTAPVWQRDYFDRWMRSPEHTAECARYILDNPVRRWPDIESYPWVIHVKG
jgi:REP element-mobilizing transposase RayT